MPIKAYTVRETCALLSISKATFYRILAAGDLRIARVGHGTRVFADELERYQAAAREAA
jgi:excisionase family DNA binding protein